MKKNRGRILGFTLIELLTVMAIISVLASVAIPNLIKFQAKAKQAEVKVNLKAEYTYAKAQYAAKSTYSSAYINFGYSSGKNFLFENNTVYNYGYGGNYIGCTKANCRKSYDVGKGSASRSVCPTSATTCGNKTGGNASYGVVWDECFCFTAWGDLDIDNTLDFWQMNHNGVINNGLNSNCAVKDSNGFCSRSYQTEDSSDINY